jgi:hypothetical protein
MAFQNETPARAMPGLREGSRPGGLTASGDNQSHRNFQARRGVQLQCEACSKPFGKRGGRRKRFCSDACRKVAERVKEAACCSQAQCSVASGNDLISPSSSTGCNAKTPDPYPSRLSVPVDVLGRGHRWPGAKPIDRKTWANIVHREIGGER